MPRGDGTGPTGTGPIGQKNAGQGRGKNNGTKAGLGLGGNCVCPNCNTIVPHTTGTPCYAMTCPACGAKMVRG
jgi:hypothetical protein